MDGHLGWVDCGWDNLNGWHLREYLHLDHLLLLVAVLRQRHRRLTRCVQTGCAGHAGAGERDYHVGCLYITYGQWQCHVSMTLEIWQLFNIAVHETMSIQCNNVSWRRISASVQKSPL